MQALVLSTLELTRDQVCVHSHAAIERQLLPKIASFHPIARTYPQDLKIIIRQ